MDNNQVNESVKASSASPIVNVSLSKEYQELIKEAALITGAVSISGFIRQAALEKAQAVRATDNTLPTLAS